MSANAPLPPASLELLLAVTAVPVVALLAGTQALGHYFYSGQSQSLELFRSQRLPLLPFPVD